MSSIAQERWLANKTIFILFVNFPHNFQGPSGQTIWYSLYNVAEIDVVKNMKASNYGASNSDRNAISTGTDNYKMKYVPEIKQSLMGIVSN